MLNLKEFFTEKLANNMFGKKVGEKRLATRKMSGKNKIVERILSLVKNSATFLRLFYFFKIRYIKKVCL